MKTVYCSLIFLLWQNPRMSMSCAHQHDGLLCKEEFTIAQFLEELPVSKLFRVKRVLTNRRKNPELTHLQHQQGRSLPWYHNIRRQLPPRRRRRKNGRPGNGLTRNMLQMSLLALSFLAFSTMIAGMLMRNLRSTRPGKPVVHNILIKPSPKMEESSTEAFISHLLEGGLEMIGEAVAKMSN